MPWLEQDRENGPYQLEFRYNDKRLKRSLRTKDERLANELLVRVKPPKPVSSRVKNGYQKGRAFKRGPQSSIRSKPDEDEQTALWDWLPLPEIDEFLKAVREHARHPSIYPMIMTAARF